VAEAAQKASDVFVKHGLLQDFIEQLKASASALETARNATVESTRRRLTATAALHDQVKRGRKAVRLLNAILEPRLAKDPERLAAWRSAKRVRPTSAVSGSEGSAASTIKVA
jgi:Xaa-Pro aminopeptidase